MSTLRYTMSILVGSWDGGDSFFFNNKCRYFFRDWRVDEVLSELLLSSNRKHYDHFSSGGSSVGVSNLASGSRSTT